MEPSSHIVTQLSAFSTNTLACLLFHYRVIAKQASTTRADIRCLSRFVVMSLAHECIEQLVELEYVGSDKGLRGVNDRCRW